jgi:hypothetical protein
MNRPAPFRQADVERVIRAAKRQGAARVTVKVGSAEVAVDLREPVELPPISPPQTVDEPEVVDL